MARSQLAGAQYLRPNRQSLRRGRRKLGYALGLTGQPQATRRFFRFAFFVRALLLVPTPFFFFLPGPQYQGSLRSWVVYVVLLAWTAFLAYMTWRNDELMKRAWFIHLFDLLVVFGAFIATTHAGPDTPNPTYGEVVIVGAFQLQTYGAVATAAALTGIVDGVAFAVVAAGLYVVSLKAIGTSLRDVIDASHVQGSVGRTLLYLIIGIAFGLYNVLVGRLVSVRRRMFDVLATSRSKGHDRTDAQERARFLSQLHERGLGQLHAVRNALEDTADDLAGEAKERVSGINAYFAATLDAISAGPGEARGDGVTEAVADVLRDVCRTHRLVSVKSHFVELRLEDDRGTELDTYRAERLRDILGEALHNAVKHSCPGQVEIVLARLEGHDFVVVSDPGPLDEPGRGNQLGHEQITRRALACGWRWRWAPACGVGGRSELRLLLAPDAGPLDRINAI